MVNNSGFMGFFVLDVLQLANCFHLSMYNSKLCLLYCCMFSPHSVVIQFKLQVIKSMFSFAPLLFCFALFLFTHYNPFDLLLNCHQCPIKNTSVLFQALWNGWHFANFILQRFSELNRSSARQQRKSGGSSRGNSKQNLSARISNEFDTDIRSFKMQSIK